MEIATSFPTESLATGVTPGNVDNRRRLSTELSPSVENYITVIHELPTTN
jgi:hypothetical protein